MPTDYRLIVALDVPNLLDGGNIVDQLGDSVSFYKIGLGMLTGGGLALANELKQRGKRVFMDMKFFDIGATLMDYPNIDDGPLTAFIPTPSGFGVKNARTATCQGFEVLN